MKKIQKKLIIFCMFLFAVSQIHAQIEVGISARIAPPELPVYTQPACPVDGYLWQPGYWAYDNNDGYYWVPGVWVAPPQPDYLWTPSYWGYEGGYYGFHSGYWGLHVGFYGGINYGFGYGGVGFGGGMWSGGHFRYNTAVVNVNRTVIHNTYINRTVINNRTVNRRVSFNGPGGINAKPRQQELAAMREHHIQPTARQMSHQEVASKNKAQFASVNHGRPAATAMNKVGGKPFNQHGRIAANTSFGHSANAERPSTHPNGNNHPSSSARSFTAHTTAPRPHEREQAPRVQQHIHQQRAQLETRPQPHAEAPRPQQHVEAPHPQQHVEAPRPQQHEEAPRPQQHVAAPRPQPAQHMPSHERHG